MIDLLMCSRRTIMSGEAVDVACEFVPHHGPFGGFDALGQIHVSGSRDAVIVHRASCQNAAEAEALIEAIRFAESVRRTLAPHWQGGHPSQYPSEPTPIPRPADGDSKA